MTPEMNMVHEKEKIIFAHDQETCFEAVLDEACKILEHKQIQYSLRRLKEFDENLENLERELDAIIEKFENAG